MKKLIPMTVGGFCVWLGCMGSSGPAPLLIIFGVFLLVYFGFK